MEIARIAPMAPPTVATGGPLEAAMPEAAHSGRAESPVATHETRIDIDPATRDVIYRVIDVDSGTVVTQIPSEALLKLRAYMRALFDAHAADKTV